MITFTTRTEAIEFLVLHHGKPLNRAKVAVDQSFNHGHGDLIAHDFNFDNGDLDPCSATEQDVLQTYNDMCGEDIPRYSPYFTLEADGFHFEDGELMYDVNGDPIK